MAEEPFGPIAPIATFTDLDDALERANGTPFGLAAYAFTRDQGAAAKLSRGLKAGMVGVNAFMGAHAEAPFGGVDQSGMGREGGRQAIHDYLNVKMTHFAWACAMAELMENPLRRIWAEKRCAVNGWLAVPSVLSAEVMARSGWDALTIDLQHGMADYAAMTAMLAVIGQTPTVPMVRAPWNDEASVTRALDAGALGVIRPMIETAADARRFVSACLYPPAGGRSVGPIRARLAHGDGYGAAAKGLDLPLAMIETRAALENLDAIAAVEGLAGLYIGPADLASALGHPPGFDRREPELLAAIGEIREAAQSAGPVACIHCGAPDYAAMMARDGFDLATIGSDARFMEAGARAAVSAFRGSQG